MKNFRTIKGSGNYYNVVDKKGEVLLSGVSRKDGRGWAEYANEIGYDKGKEVLENHDWAMNYRLRKSDVKKFYEEASGGEKNACQRCGTEILKGHFYCDKCSKEISKK